MTRFDEALEDLARGAEAPMRERLELVPVVDLGARVTRGRRKRAAGLGAGLTAGLAAVLVVATLTATGARFEPGSTAASERDAGAVRFDLMPGGSYPEGDPQIDLRIGGRIECGMAIDLSNEVVVHNQAALDRELTFVARPRVITETGDELLPEYLRAGFDALQWEFGHGESAGAVIEWQVVPLVLDQGVVVGVGVSEGMAGAVAEGGRRVSADTTYGPLPGDCSGGSNSAPQPVPDGEYQHVLVVQALLQSQLEPWVTFIVPGGGLEVEHQGLEEYWANVAPEPKPSAEIDPSTIEHLFATTRVPLGEIPGGAGVRELTGVCERAGAAFEVDSLKLVPFEAPTDRPDWIFGPDWGGMRGVSWLWRERLDGVDTPWYAYGAGTTALFFDESGALVSIAAAQGNTVGTPSGAFIDQRMDFAAQPQCGISAGAPGVAGIYRVVVVIPNPVDAATRLDITNVNGLELWVDLGDIVVE